MIGRDDSGAVGDGRATSESLPAAEVIRKNDKATVTRTAMAAHAHFRNDGGAVTGGAIMRGA